MTEPDERTMRIFITNANGPDGRIGWHELPIGVANTYLANRQATLVDPAEVLAAEHRRTMGLTAPRRPS
jgi:hypothetical protein